MKPLYEYVSESREQNRANQRKNDLVWSEVIKEILGGGWCEKFLKDNGIDADVEMKSYNHTDINSPSLTVEIELTWELEDFLKWFNKHKNIGITQVGSEDSRNEFDDFYAATNIKNKFNFNVFKVQPDCVQKISINRRDKYNAHITLYWGEKELKSIIDQSIKGTSSNPDLPTFGTPGGENDGAGRKIKLDDVVFVCDIQKLARVTNVSGKQITILTADGKEDTVAGESMIIVQRGSSVIR